MNRDGAPRFYPDNVPAAGRLRREMTPSERAIWGAVRARRFHGLKFRRQHPIGPFVIDFYCEHLHVAVEVDGAVHDDPARRRQDAARQALIERLDRLGVRFVRIAADDAASDAAGALERALAGYLSNAPPR